MRCHGWRISLGFKVQDVHASVVGSVLVKRLICVEYESEHTLATVD